MASHMGPNQARGVDIGGGVGQLQILSAKTLQNWQRVFEVPSAGGVSGAQRAQSLASTLNGVFSDTARDADFITPSYVFPADTATWPNGAYSVVWTVVRGADTCNTTFLGGDPVEPECLYAGCQFSNCSTTYVEASKASYQTDLWYLRPEDLSYYADVAWDLALFLSNQLRNAIDAIDDRGRSLQLLNTSGLHNFAAAPYSKLCEFYLGGEQVVHPYTACFGGVETAHTADLTIATDTVDLDCNIWVRLTDQASGLSVVARATDDSPAGHIEGTFGGIGIALKLGSSGCTNRTVTVGAP